MKHEFFIEKRKIIVVAQIKGINGLIGMDFLLRFQNLKFNFDEKNIEAN